VAVVPVPQEEQEVVHLLKAKNFNILFLQHKWVLVQLEQTQTRITIVLLLALRDLEQKLFRTKNVQLNIFKHRAVSV
jgi:hypothetical protein